ncbi:MAG: ABC transporter substrate-binding protein [Candidatus Hodarchaeales archaeon]|jgi:peptide/nickel transport system substrate-binding protein
MKYKKLNLIACLIILALMAVNTQAMTNQIPKGGTLTVVWHDDVSSLNPFYWSTSYDLGIMNHIYEPLIRENLNYEYFPNSGLATAWDVTPNGLTWNFSITEDAFWHDGTPLTILDVNFTHQLFWADVNDTLTRRSWIYDWTTDISVINSSAISFTFSYAVAPADVYAEIGLWWIVPKHIWSVVDATTFTNTELVGCGPWVYEEHVPGDFWRFSSYADYHLQAGGTHLDEKVIKMIHSIETAFFQLQTGEVDYLVNPPKDLITLAELDPDIDTHHALIDDILYLGMNQYRYPNNEIRFRQAVMHAINVSELIEFAFETRGEVATSAMSMAYGPYFEPNVRKYPFNVTLANEILDNLGWMGTWNGTEGTGVRSTVNGTPLVFDYSWVSTWETSTRAAYLIQAMMSRIGVQLILDPTIFTTLWDRMGGTGSQLYDYDWAFMDWIEFWSDHHPSWMKWMFDIDGWWGSDDVNLIGWSGANRTAVSDLAVAVTTANDTYAKELLSQAQIIVGESLPYLPLFWSEQVSCFRVDEFTGWQMDYNSGPNNYYSWMDLHWIAEPTTTTEVTAETTLIETVISGTTILITSIVTVPGDSTSGFTLATVVFGSVLAFYIKRKRNKK